MSIRKLAIPFVLAVGSAGCASTYTIATQDLDRNTCWVTDAEETRQKINDGKGGKKEELVQRRVTGPGRFDGDCAQQERDLAARRLDGELKRIQNTVHRDISLERVKASAEIVTTALNTPNLSAAKRAEIVSVTLAYLNVQVPEIRDIWQAAVHKSGNTEAGLRLEFNAQQGRQPSNTPQPGNDFACPYRVREDGVIQYNCDR